jgi:hypothetical protein
VTNRSEADELVETRPTTLIAINPASVDAEPLDEALELQRMDGEKSAREVPMEAKIAPAANDAAEPPLLIRAKPVTGAVAQAELRPLPTRTLPNGVAEPQVAGYAADVSANSTVVKAEPEPAQEE